jgi:hypothetical protein
MRALNERKREARWLLFLAVAFSWLLFVSRYAYFPLYMLHQTIPGTESLLVWGYWLLFIGDLLFTRLWLYLTLSVLGLMLVIAAWAKSRAGWLGRTALLVGLLAIVALPVVYRYEPAVQVEPTYAAQVITQPRGLAGVVKRMRAGAEVRACEYTLLGWSASQEALYGEQLCGAKSHLWSYTPLFDDHLREVQTVPPDVVQDVVTRTALEGVKSTIPQDKSLSLAVQKPILISPEGEWHALVAQHIYGPEDVVVIATHPSE